MVNELASLLLTSEHSVRATALILLLITDSNLLFLLLYHYYLVDQILSHERLCRRTWIRHGPAGAECVRCSSITNKYATVRQEGRS